MSLRSDGVVRVGTAARLNARMAVENDPVGGAERMADSGRKTGSPNSQVVRGPEEAERAVLGAILNAGCLSVDAGHRVVGSVRAAGLDPEHFWRASHGALYAVLVEMAEAGIPVDPVSVATELDREHADPRLVARLHVLAHEVFTITAAERYAQIVVDGAVRREIDERQVVA